MRVLLAVLGVFFLAGAVLGLQAVMGAGDVSGGGMAALALGLAIQVSLATLFFFLAYRSHQGEKNSKAFLAWLQKNAQDVMNNGARYDGVLITPNTEMRQYIFTVSVLVMTFKNPSRFYVSGIDSFPLANAGHSLTTLLLGWWGFPWGPIYSVQALYKNLGGGVQYTVGQLLTDNQVA
jgi:hypothetical protein